jgi:hypothetical protein
MNRRERSRSPERDRSRWLEQSQLAWLPCTPRTTDTIPSPKNTVLTTPSEFAMLSIKNSRMQMGPIEPWEIRAP